MQIPKTCLNALPLGLLLCGSLSICGAEDTTTPLAPADLVFAEQDGLVAVEAEHFISQTLADTRAFNLSNSNAAPAIEPDGDPAHAAGASGGAYLEILPDSRRDHSEKLIRNFEPRYLPAHRIHNTDWSSDKAALPPEDAQTELRSHRPPQLPVAAFLLKLDRRW